MVSDGLRYDAVVVGGGHNGLVCAAYLARAGMKTLVLERRHLVGGAAVTEEVWPGFKVSTASYVVSLFSARVVQELELPKYGYHVYPLDPAYFAPFPDGSGFLLWDDPARAAEEIGRLNAEDGRAYLEYNRHLGELADLVRPLLYRRPPDPGVRSMSDLVEALSLGRYAFGNRRSISRIVDLMTMSCADFLDRFFVDERVMGALAPGGVIGMWGGPMSPGSAYVLLHHRMGEIDGVTGGWGFVRGGMGGVSEAIAASARAAGAEIRTNAEVGVIDVRDGLGGAPRDHAALAPRGRASAGGGRGGAKGLQKPEPFGQGQLRALGVARPRGDAGQGGGTAAFGDHDQPHPRVPGEGVGRRQVRTVLRGADDRRGDPHDQGPDHSP
jgi:phytoene dehydrogenase-like protein